MTLPKWATDIIVNMLLPIAKLAGKNGLVEVLKNLKTKDPNLYTSIVITGYRWLVVHVKPLADDSTTPWDNEAVDLVIAAIKQSATDNHVPLPDVTIVPALAPVP